MFSFARKTSIYRKDFRQYPPIWPQKYKKPGDTFTINNKNYKEPFLIDDLCMIECELEQCSMDLWPIIKRKIISKRMLLRRFHEKKRSTHPQLSS